MTLISPDSYPQQGVMQLTALSARALRSTTGTCGYPLAGKERLFCYILIPPNLQNQWSQLRVDEGTRRRRCFQDHVLVLLFNSISLQHESCRQKRSPYLRSHQVLDIRAHCELSLVVAPLNNNLDTNKNWQNIYIVKLRMKVPYFQSNHLNATLQYTVVSLPTPRQKALPRQLDIFAMTSITS